MLIFRRLPEPSFLVSNSKAFRTESASCFLLLWFRRERSHDLFKPRVATERVPKRHQFQLAIAEIAWGASRDRQLFAREIFFAHPCRNHRQILHHRDAHEGILFDWTKFHRSSTLAQRFLFASKTGIDQTKRAQCWSIIWLSLDGFLRLSPCSDERGPYFGIVPRHPGDNPFHKMTIESNIHDRT